MTAAASGIGPVRPARSHPRRHRNAERIPTGDIVRLAAWTAALLLAARALHATGDPFRLPTDSLRSAGEWARAATPVEMAGAALRLAALVAVWYLLAATVVALVADRAGRPGLVRVVARLTPALVRRTVVRGGGVGLAVGALVGSALPADTATAGPGAPAPAPMSLLPALPGPASDADGTATMTRLPPARGAPGEATMIRLPDDDSVAGRPDAIGRPPGGGSPTAAPRSGGSPDRASPEGTPTPAAGVSAPGRPDDASGSADTWVVGSGDSFWSIATEVIEEAGGARRPRGHDIAPYWRELIAANRDRLVVPDDPDILLPGQELLLPTPPAVGSDA